VQFMSQTERNVSLLLHARGRGNLAVYDELSLFLECDSASIAQTRWRTIKEEYDVAKRVCLCGNCSGHLSGTSRK
jgi:hypothetical protein